MIKIEKIQEVILQDFLDEQGIEVIIKEHPPRFVEQGAAKYYVDTKPMIESKEYPDHPILRGICGNGENPFAALKDFAKNLEGQYLVINALGGKKIRRELYAPQKLVAISLSPSPANDEVTS